MSETSNRNPWPELMRVHTIVFDFDGVFTDNGVYVDENGLESVRCDRADGLSISILRTAIEIARLATQMFILSRESNPVVRRRASKLRLECHDSVDSKKSFMDQYFTRTRPADGAPYTGMVMLGNDLNDLPLIEAAGFSVVPADAHPLVHRHADAVLAQKGGHGFVRAFVERLLHFETLSRGELDEFVRNC